MSNIRYFAYYDENGALVNIGTVNTSGEVHGEITAEEYERLKTEIEANMPQPEEPTSDIEEALAILHGEVSEQ